MCSPQPVVHTKFMPAVGCALFLPAVGCALVILLYVLIPCCWEMLFLFFCTYTSLFTRCGSALFTRCGSALFTRCGSALFTRCGSALLTRCGVRSSHPLWVRSSHPLWVRSSHPLWVRSSHPLWVRSFIFFSPVSSNLTIFAHRSRASLPSLRLRTLFHVLRVDWCSKHHSLPPSACCACRGCVSRGRLLWVVTVVSLSSSSGTLWYFTAPWSPTLAPPTPLRSSALLRGRWFAVDALGLHGWVVYNNVLH